MLNQLIVATPDFQPIVEGRTEFAPQCLPRKSMLAESSPVQRDIAYIPDALIDSIGNVEGVSMGIRHFVDQVEMQNLVGTTKVAIDERPRKRQHETEQRQSDQRPPRFVSSLAVAAF